MDEDITSMGLKERVKGLQEPLDALVRSLPDATKPRRRMDASDNRFNDQPWQGEWDNHFEDIGMEP